MLKVDGLLVLKEATSAHDFNTLTFGLTPEWWGFDDPEIRLPGAPLLSRAGWATALEAARFRDPRATGLAGPDEVESVLLARALVHRPKVLLLDEPLDGLDAESLARMRRHLSELSQTGIALVVVTHRHEELPVLSFNERYLL